MTGATAETRGELRFEVPLHRELRPWPVSRNKQYRSGGRRLTAPAVAWKRTVYELAWLAWHQLGEAGRAELTSAPLWAVELVWDFGPWHTGRPDLDNVDKLVLDALAAATGVNDRRFVPAPRLSGPGPRASLAVSARPAREGGA